MNSAAPDMRPVRLGAAGMTIEWRADGSLVARNQNPLGPYPKKITDRLIHWANVAPNRVFLGQRTVDRSWRTITYAEFYERTRRIAASLLSRGLSAERPLVLLSGNGIENALLLHAAMLVGVPCAPVSPAYALLVKDYAQLRRILALLQPGMIFANHLDAFAKALNAVPVDGVELVTSGEEAGFAATSFEELSSSSDSAAVDEANARVNGDTVAKILFTSGSTGVPKGVINTQRMLCSNQQMILSMLPCFEDEPPVTVDWLPWHHTFGGNHNLGLVLYNGGTLYIDEGRPVPGGFAATIENLREIAPTVYFNVPRGYEELVPVLKRDEALRRKFFSRIRLIFYAAASLSQAVRNELAQLAVQTCGEQIAMVSGFGCTETAPSSLCPVRQCDRAGFVGIPASGVEVKLVPELEKMEARVRGPHVTPGYWRSEELTTAAFDDEGFYRMGDALAFLDPHHPEEGFVFDGRLAEDFKLSSGTWVRVGSLRTLLVSHFSPFVVDAAITGHDRDEIGALIFPNFEVCRTKAGLPPDARIEDVISHPAIREIFQFLLDGLAARSTGSSNRVARIVLQKTWPSLDSGEITEKGSLNQLRTLSQRADMVQQLYSDPSHEGVIAVRAR